jgi:hypothetical protein
MGLKASTPQGLIWTLAIAALFATFQAQSEQMMPAADGSDINWLFDQGLISEEEYQQKREQILATM